ncbi:MAG: hypothetical protein AAFV53_05880 [Myxococcota bacterium]
MFTVTAKRSSGSTATPSGLRSIRTRSTFLRRQVIGGFVPERLIAEYVLSGMGRLQRSLAPRRARAGAAAGAGDAARAEAQQ